MGYFTLTIDMANSYGKNDHFTDRSSAWHLTCFDPRGESLRTQGTEVTQAQAERWRRRVEVLWSYGDPCDRPTWLGDVDLALRSSGFVSCRAHSGPDTIKRVEQGGLAGAILIADQTRIHGLSLLRIIRSIDLELPCWLVTPEASRQVLEAALALHVTSVITYPVEVNELTLGLRKHLMDTNFGN